MLNSPLLLLPAASMIDYTSELFEQAYPGQKNEAGKWYTQLESI